MKNAFNAFLDLRYSCMIAGFRILLQIRGGLYIFHARDLT